MRRRTLIQLAPRASRQVTRKDSSRGLVGGTRYRQVRIQGKATSSKAQPSWVTDRSGALALLDRWQCTGGRADALQPKHYGHLRDLTRAIADSANPDEARLVGVHQAVSCSGLPEPWPVQGSRGPVVIRLSCCRISSRRKRSKKLPKVIMPKQWVTSIRAPLRMAAHTIRVQSAQCEQWKSSAVDTSETLPSLHATQDHCLCLRGRTLPTSPPVRRCPVTEEGLGDRHTWLAHLCMLSQSRSLAGASCS